MIGAKKKKTPSAVVQKGMSTRWTREKAQIVKESEILKHKEIVEGCRRNIVEVGIRDRDSLSHTISHSVN